MVTGCELSGRKAGSMSHVHWGSQPAVLALRSQLVLARTSARGGDGAGSFAASPALDLTSCEVVLRGDAASLIEAGALGMEPYDRFWVRDEITGDEYQWGQSNYVRIDPVRAVAHVLNMPQVPADQRLSLLRRE